MIIKYKVYDQSLKIILAKKILNNILNDLKTWKNNGINNLQYDVISQENFDKISRIKVNINKKWYNKKERQWQIQ